jgi:hypothetical protein
MLLQPLCGTKVVGPRKVARYTGTFLRTEEERRELPHCVNHKGFMFVSESTPTQSVNHLVSQITPIQLCEPILSSLEVHPWYLHTSFIRLKSHPHSVFEFTLYCNSSQISTLSPSIYNTKLYIQTQKTTWSWTATAGSHDKEFWW